MEVIKFLTKIAFVFTLISCTNTHEFETGEIRTFQILREALGKKNNLKNFPDSRKILSRKQIDKFNMPILFAELKSGQNGTLTLYPGQGDGQTWLGADGATITLDQGVLKASRGMGDDIMGGTSFMPNWQEIKKSASYQRNISYLAGNNLLNNMIFMCNITNVSKEKVIDVWGLSFKVDEYSEHCSGPTRKIKNTYFVDKKGIVRRSSQFHSETVGQILIERIDK